MQLVRPIAATFLGLAPHIAVAAIGIAQLELAFIILLYDVLIIGSLPLSHSLKVTHPFLSIVLDRFFIFGLLFGFVTTASLFAYEFGLPLVYLQCMLGLCSF